MAELIKDCVFTAEYVCNGLSDGLTIAELLTVNEEEGDLDMCGDWLADIDTLSVFCGDSVYPGLDE